VRLRLYTRQETESIDRIVSLRKENLSYDKISALTSVSKTK
jgi:hypothetical protein